VQVASTARRKEGSKNRKKKIQQETSKHTQDFVYETNKPAHFIMPARSKRLQKKRPHNLHKVLTENHPNGV
ncbi:33078_t:CDS:1, partial [Gigaspora margarita]